MDLPTAARRQGFRLAHFLLRIWWFLRRPTVNGVKCLLTDGDLVLLVRHTYGSPAWDLPGGGVKRDEQPLNAARREIGEELGIEVDHWNHIGALRSTVYHRNDTLNFFSAELPAPNLKLDRAELADARWFPRDAVPADASRYVTGALALVRAAAPA
jgi:8-oxo-dGTP pyrophosphatase MutT (NUDIX family)